MAYRMGEMTLMRMSDPPRWKALVKDAIQRHAGRVLHVAQDLLVGRSTLKRWVAEDPELQHWVEQARAGKPLTPYVAPGKQVRLKRRRVA